MDGQKCDAFFSHNNETVYASIAGDMIKICNLDGKLLGSIKMPYTDISFFTIEFQNNNFYITNGGMLYIVGPDNFKFGVV